MEDSELNMMEEKPPMVEVPSKSSLRKSVWPSVKPFVNGGLYSLLQGSCQYLLVSSFYTFNPAAKVSDKIINRKLLNMYQRIPFTMFQGGINMATLFGSYEHLTRKVQALNDGRPLTLYQEVGCGLASGAIRCYVCHPLRGPVGTDIVHSGTNKYYYFKQIFSTITQVVRNEGVLALWKGTSYAIPPVIASTTAMLVSYDRCRIYLKETYGLREDDARIGAGIFSGLCSVACYEPVAYASAIIHQSKRVITPHRFLLYALKILKPGGGADFYSELAKHVVSKSPNIMVMWVLLEAIRDAEESIGL